MSTPLADKIKSMIRQSGPISVRDYFALCLGDPDHGYYRKKEPFGVDGDFVTAPEISQLFGEMIGIFLIHAWQRHGKPENVRLCEIGPGRGTMMSDILRVIEKLAPDLFANLHVHLVETSDRLQKVQSQTLVEYKFKIDWHADFNTVPDGFLLAVANELFDAIPIRQIIKMGSDFHERMVDLDELGNLTFALGPPVPDEDRPSLIGHYSDGTILEPAPDRAAFMQTICDRLIAGGGTFITIDYGSLASGVGDTLQAIKNHSFDPPLANPGEADLTSHVDFEALAAVARNAGLQVHGIQHQGDFLLGLGLLQRAGALGQGSSALTQDAIRIAVQRIAGEGAGNMGELFKVLAVSSPAIALTPFEVTDTH
ncbi:MAG: hypothetical protein RIR97_1078 [Pseudomonadota bacterium]